MIDTVIRAALKDLFEGRVFANVFPQTANGQIQSRLPAARFQIISATNAPTVCGTDDRSTDDTRVQIDVVASDWDALSPLIDDVIDALSDTDPPCERDNYFTTFDEPTRTHRAVLDFIFQPSSVFTP